MQEEYAVHGGLTGYGWLPWHHLPWRVGCLKCSKPLRGTGFKHFKQAGAAAAPHGRRGRGSFFRSFFTDSVGDGFDETVPVDVLDVCAL